MKQRNILLTSLGNLGDRLSHRYFYYKGTNNLCFCDGIGVAEAGAKYVLSQVPIDEIIVLGSGASYVEGEANTSLVLREWVDFDTEDINNLSEYSFFRYRILQYLDELDLEGSEVLYSLDRDDVNRLTEIYERFKDAAAQKMDMLQRNRMFSYLAQDPSYVDLLMETAGGTISEKEFKWLKHYCYLDLGDRFRLHPLEANADLRICFIPTVSGTEAGKPLENVMQIVQAIEHNEEEDVNLYVDMQGLEASDGFTMLSVLTMLSDENHTRFNIRQIITTHYHPDAFANPIDSDAMTRYEISILAAGMNVFLRYGSVDIVMDYWKSRDIENRHIDQLLFAMQRVSDGISLCNIYDLEYGIRLLRTIFRETPSEPLPELESNIFTILESGIQRDYGALLEGDSVRAIEMAKWAFRKKFYQQTLTIIESRIPEDIVKDGIFFYAVDEESKKNYLDSVNRLYWKDNPRNKWMYRNTSHFFVKTYGRINHRPGGSDKDRDMARYRIKSLDIPAEGDEKGVAKAYSFLDDNTALLEDLLYSYYKLSFSRNSINHANTGANTAVLSDLDELDTTEPNPVVQMMIDSISHFIRAYDQALDHIRKRRERGDELAAPCLVGDEEAMGYYSSHRIERDKEETEEPSGEGKPTDGGDHGRGRRGRNRRNNKKNPDRASGDTADAGKAGEPGKNTVSVTEDGKKLVRVTVEIEV